MRYLVHVLQRQPNDDDDFVYRRHKIGTFKANSYEHAKVLASAAEMANGHEAVIVVRVRVLHGTFIDVPTSDLRGLADDLHRAANSIEEQLANQRKFSAT